MAIFNTKGIHVALADGAEPTVQVLWNISAVLGKELADILSWWSSAYLTLWMEKLFWPRFKSGLSNLRIFSTL